MENEIKYKVCTKCKNVLSVKNFQTDNRSKDKLWRYCRRCESDRKKKYREAKKLKLTISTTAKLPIIKNAKKSKIIIDTKTKPSELAKITISAKNYGKLHNDMSKEQLVKNWFGAHNHSTKIVLINLRKIDEHMKKSDSSYVKRGFSFYDKVINTISHEFLHTLIQDTDGIWTSRSFDNIANKLSYAGFITNPKNWHEIEKMIELPKQFKNKKFKFIKIEY